MKDLISVIVPVYNVAAYLPACLDSILQQDYEKLEIILIDDGSRDESGAICDAYAARDSRIRVIHQKNGGAAAAKNAGLRRATGEYLSFVDSDDILLPGAYSHMLGLLRQQHADVVQCAFADLFPSGAVPQVKKPGFQELDAMEYLQLYTTDWTCALLWDKLYRRELFDGIFFEEGNKIDDEYFTYRGVMNAGKVVCDDRLVYHYRKRRSSVMYSPESAARIVLDRIDYLGKRRKHVAERFPALRRRFDLHFLDAMILLDRDPAGTEASHRRIIKSLDDYFREKEHTMPPVGLWPHLIKVRVGWDAKHRKSSPEADNIGDRREFFD